MSEIRPRRLALNTLSIDYEQADQVPGKGIYLCLLELCKRLYDRRVKIRLINES